MSSEKNRWLYEEVIAPRDRKFDNNVMAFYPVTRQDGEVVVHIGDCYVSTFEDMKKRSRKIIEVDTITGGHPTIIWERRTKRGKSRS